MSRIKIAPSAQKSLALQKDGVFRLLVVMTTLLGWVIAMGFGGLVLMQNVYSQWHLSRSQEVSVYLLADSPTAEVKTLTDKLINLDGVTAVNRLPSKDVQALIAPYVSASSDGMTSFPLPIVLNIGVREDVNYDDVVNTVQTAFPAAEVDDARALLATAASAVRLAQSLALALSACLFVVMAFLVTLTVRTGLRAQQETLAILRYIGSTDAFLNKLVVQQVVRRTLVGWALASGLALISFALLIWLWPLLQTYTLTPQFAPILLLSVVGAPLMLPLLAYIAARRATGRMLKN